jgi:Tfp pilus assembly protein PilF
MPMPWLVLVLALQDPAPATEMPAEEPPAATSAPAASGSVDRGLSLYHRRQFTRAAAEFQAAADADPQNAAAAWYLAYTWYKIAEPKRPFHPDKAKAAELFAKAFAIDPTFKPDWGRR